jgi:hypothetical protein
MTTILENENKPTDSIYGTNEKETKIFFTFFFVLFFVVFARNLILDQPIDSYTAIVTTLLITIWFGLSLVIS